MVLGGLGGVLGGSWGGPGGVPGRSRRAPGGVWERSGRPSAKRLENEPRPRQIMRPLRGVLGISGASGAALEGNFWRSKSVSEKKHDFGPLKYDFGLDFDMLWASIFNVFRYLRKAISKRCGTRMSSLKSLRNTANNGSERIYADLKHVE